jgi:hypothetical protein
VRQSNAKRITFFIEPPSIDEACLRYFLLS